MAHNADTDWQRRYSRHLILPEFGATKQKQLANAHVLVIGAGGLGCASLPYLAASGIGEITVIDFDSVELSNLQRQVLFEEGDVGRSKVEAAKDALEERNSNCLINAVELRADVSNLRPYIEKADIVLDGCDRFETRFAVNTLCHATKTPLVSAAVIGWEGQISSFDYSEHSPCYQCFVPEAPQDADTCTETGVISPLCGMFGSMQALEAIKLLTQSGDTLVGTLLRYNALTSQMRSSTLHKDAHCPCCGSPS